MCVRVSEILFLLERVDETRRSRGYPENLDFDRRVEGLEFGLIEFDGGGGE